MRWVRSWLQKWSIASGSIFDDGCSALSNARSKSGIKAIHTIKTLREFICTGGKKMKVHKKSRPEDHSGRLCIESYLALLFNSRWFCCDSFFFFLLSYQFNNKRCCYE